MLARQRQAAVLVFALGTNDSRDITAACVPKAVANVRGMIARARQQYGTKLRIVLAGPPNINKAALVATKPIANEREAKLRDIGDAFAAPAKATVCEFTSHSGIVPAASLPQESVPPDAAGSAAHARVVPRATSRRAGWWWQGRGAPGPRNPLRDASDGGGAAHQPGRVRRQHGGEWGERLGCAGKRQG